jgi:hypothetical protein
MPKPIEECTTVLELLEDPARWTQGWYYKNETGREISDAQFTYLGEVASVCLVGAVKILCGKFQEDTPFDYDKYRDKQVKLQNAWEEKYPEYAQTIAPYWNSFVRWQDDPARTHEEVLELVRLAQV